MHQLNASRLKSQALLERRCMTHPHYTKVERLIDLEYAQIIKPLAISAHQESIFGQAPFSEKKFQKQLGTIHDTEKTLILCGFHNQVPVAYTYAVIGEHYISDGLLLANIVSIYVEPNVRRTYPGGRINFNMNKMLYKWAKESFCSGLMFSVTSGVEMTSSDKYFRKMKARTLGGNYLLQIR